MFFLLFYAAALIKSDGSGSLQTSASTMLPPPTGLILDTRSHTEPPTAALNRALCFLNCQIKHVTPSEWDTHMPAAS